MAAAGVSRSWLYQQPELRAQINQLRDRPASGDHAAVPTAEQATADSLRQLVHTYRAEVNRLRTENQTLREQLARRLGAERAAAITLRSRTTSKTCPQRHSPQSTGPTTQMIKRRSIMPTA